MPGNKGSGVAAVKKHTYEEDKILNEQTNNIGSSFGS